MAKYLKVSNIWGRNVLLPDFQVSHRPSLQGVIPATSPQPALAWLLTSCRTPTALARGLLSFLGPLSSALHSWPSPLMWNTFFSGFLRLYLLQNSQLPQRPLLPVSSSECCLECFELNSGPLSLTTYTLSNGLFSFKALKIMYVAGSQLQPWPNCGLPHYPTWPSPLECLD